MAGWRDVSDGLSHGSRERNHRDGAEIGGESGVPRAPCGDKFGKSWLSSNRNLFRYDSDSIPIWGHGERPKHALDKLGFRAIVFCAIVIRKKDKSWYDDRNTNRVSLPTSSQKRPYCSEWTQHMCFTKTLWNFYVLQLWRIIIVEDACGGGDINW